MPPSGTASWTRASSKRTGTCRGASSFVARAELRTSLDPEVPEVALDLALDAGELAAPASGLPDLEVVGVPDDDSFSRERRVLAKVGRDDDAPLGVRVRLMRARQQEVAEPRDRGLGAWPLADLDVERGPLRGRKDGKAFAYPTRHDRSFFEAGPELGRYGEPTLLVQRVGEFASEIAFQVPFRLWETVPHRPPLLTTRRAIYSTAGRCQ